MSKFKWGYIGSGSIAKATARSITKGNHQITAVYSRTREKAEAFAEKYGAKVYSSPDEMLEKADIDGVYIATPHTSHLEYSVKALQAGKSVLCEKPVGVSTEEVELILKASRDNNAYFCEAMWTWFSDVALQVKKWVSEKQTGEIKSVHIDYAFPGIMMSKNSRLLKPETAGGALLDIGIYPVTYCYNLFDVPEKIKCTGTLKNGIDVEETIILGYGGFECELEISLMKLKEGCKITGTEGEISVPLFHMGRTATLKTKTKKETFTGKTDYLTEFSRAAKEIKRGMTESAYVPHKATVECMKILDECRRQLKLVYPFEKSE